jgi:hypothetical protein
VLQGSRLERICLDWVCLKLRFRLDNRFEMGSQFQLLSRVLIQRGGWLWWQRGHACFAAKKTAGTGLGLAQPQHHWQQPREPHDPAAQPAFVLLFNNRGRLIDRTLQGPDDFQDALVQIMNGYSLSALKTKIRFELLEFGAEVPNQRAAVIVMALEGCARSVGARKLLAAQCIGVGSSGSPLRSSGSFSAILLRDP